MIFACAVLAGGAVAQDGAEPQVSEKQLAFGKRIWRTKANCIFCHGWSGNGEGQERAPRPEISLRETALTKEQVMEVVQCGRPGTKMPYHDAFAYKDDRCYGSTAEDLEELTPNRTEAGTLQRREIEAVADYVITKIKDRGPITKAECTEFWGSGAAACEKYE